MRRCLRCGRRWRRLLRRRCDCGRRCFDRPGRRYRRRRLSGARRIQDCRRDDAWAASAETAGFGGGAAATSALGTAGFGASGFAASTFGVSTFATSDLATVLAGSAALPSSRRPSNQTSGAAQPRPCCRAFHFPAFRAPSLFRPVGPEPSVPVSPVEDPTYQTHDQMLRLFRIDRRHNRDRKATPAGLCGVAALGVRHRRFLAGAASLIGIGLRGGRRSFDRIEGRAWARPAFERDGQSESRCETGRKINRPIPLAHRTDRLRRAQRLSSRARS